MNTRSTIIFITSFFISMTIYSQNIDYNKVILPEEATTDKMGEKLVQIAWQNHPSNLAVKKDKEIAARNVSLAKWTWLNQVSARGNLNEFTINPDPQINNFFPRYNFGVTIPLGIILETSNNTKIAKLEHQKTDLAIKNQKLTVRNEVLKAYQNYLMAEKILKLKNEITENEYTNYLTEEEKFENGTSTIEEYRTATKAYNKELEAKIIATNNFENAKLELEMLIGIPLEEVE
ncbi:TolC family protein [Marivirga sp.]|uniref:TolC family protein n=1 Tax=Marivirga sp. TaxID=2018662 RepID=UPI003DA6F37E